MRQLSERSPLRGRGSKRGARLWSRSIQEGRGSHPMEEVSWLGAWGLG